MEKIDPQSSLTTRASVTNLAATMSTSNTHTRNNTRIFAFLVIGVVILGVGTGYVSASLTSSKQSLTQESAKTNDAGEATTAVVPEQTVKVGQVFGSKDVTGLKDSAQGVLLSGGVGGEGSHHIARPGGVSQNVYLTSSVVDLKMFEGAKVKVSGETFKAQKAGWLMDVGRVEVLELNAPLPDGTTRVPLETQEE